MISAPSGKNKVEAPVALVVPPERLGLPPADFSPEKRIGGLPWLQRLLLTLHRAGVRRFLLVDYALTPALERALRKDARLADSVELLSPPVTLAPAALLQHMAEQAGGPFLLVSGNQIFSPSVVDSLRRQAANGSPNAPGLALLTATPGTPASILAWVRSLKDGADRAGDWLQELGRAGLVEFAPPPPEGYWQPLTSPADWRQAEEKIDLSLYKFSDNHLARLNRKMSIPISRLLVPFRVHPNTVTLITLALSIGSGISFALGSYGWGVLGGFLAWFSCLLDGTDGEVARLTFRESDFGCWLESVCDHIFDLVVFAGLAIGFYRASHDFLYLYTGLLFQFGGIMSFVVIAHQRKRTTRPGSASSYGSQWRMTLEPQRDQNFIYHFSLRYGELVRRSSLGYSLFGFALTGELGLSFLFFMSTLAANVAWILTLYSDRAFQTVSARASESD